MYRIKTLQPSTIIQRLDGPQYLSNSTRIYKLKCLKIYTPCHAAMIVTRDAADPITCTMVVSGVVLQTVYGIP